MQYKIMMSIVATMPLIFLLAFAAIGTSAMCAVIISMTLFRGIPLNIPPMIATGTIAALSFWSRSKLS